MATAGYAWLLGHFRLKCVPPHHRSEIARSARSTHKDGRRVVDLYPPDYSPGEGPVDHLVFALKYDGVELGALAQIFLKLDPHELRDALVAQPTGKYLRQLWFLYEWFGHGPLDLPDLRAGGYVDLVDPKSYFVLEGVRSPRHRIRNNLLGSRDWCPSVRRTPVLDKFVQEPLAERLTAITRDWDPLLLSRAVRYLYTKETRSSFLIEREEASGTREQRFVALLERAARLTRLEKRDLIELQRVTVEPRYAAEDYRDTAIWVGESGLAREIFHYIAPRPEDVPAMMEGLFTLMEVLVVRGRPRPLHAVVVASIVAFSFVYIHPFKDGNGRIHRFLVHYVLSRMGFTPPDTIVPISAAIVRDPRGYDQALNDLSDELLPLIDHYHDEERDELLISGDTGHLYRYPDLTVQTEALFGWVEQAIERDWLQELDFLRGMDRARQRVRLIVELPDNLERLFIRCCHHNLYRLAANKRRRFFQTLSDDEVTAMEEAVRLGFAPHEDGEDDPEDDGSP